MVDFEIKLEMVDPTGVASNSAKLSTPYNNDPERMRRDRIFVTMGDFIYHVDGNGQILETIKKI